MEQILSTVAQILYYCAFIFPFFTGYAAWRKFRVRYTPRMAKGPTYQAYVFTAMIAAGTMLVTYLVAMLLAFICIEQYLL